MWPAGRRRARAAEIWGSHADTFRKTVEPTILDQVVEGILDLAHHQRLRSARASMEARHPADSRLAVQWVTRFEAYYRIWTPVWALAADLEASLDSLTETAGPHAPWDPDGHEGTGPYDPQRQAFGYAMDALYDYAWQSLEVRRFMNTHGGLWLASDKHTEEAISDAIYRVGWHTSIDATWESWLRRALADSRHQELQHFQDTIVATSTGERIAAHWWNWVLLCSCGGGSIDDSCQVHACIRACKEYCAMVDQEWDRIADWYMPGETRPKGVEPAVLYQERLSERVPSTAGGS